MLQSKKLARREVLCGGGIAALVVVELHCRLLPWRGAWWTGNALLVTRSPLWIGFSGASTVLRATHSYVASAEGLSGEGHMWQGESNERP